MSVHLDIPPVEDLDRVVAALMSWQVDNAALQLHPGDVGWFSTAGSAATAAALRVWSRSGEILAIGLLDGDQLLRMAFDRSRRDDPELSSQIADDLDDPRRGVLNAGNATVEARGALHLKRMLSERGWRPDEPWTPLHLDLASPVRDAGLRIETVELDGADDWVRVHWSAFRDTPFTQQDHDRTAGGWLTMASGPLSGACRSLVAYDADNNPVAVATVWSAGPGRPGLLEPIGVHRDFRGKGHGTAITLAAAQMLRRMKASSAIVCAASSNVGAVSAYVAAGFAAQSEEFDLTRGD